MRGRTLSAVTRGAAALLITFSLAGCQTIEPAFITPDTPLEVEPPSPPVAEQVDFTNVLPTETFRLGLQHFKRTEYGLAERYFRATVEKDSSNVEAWIGLAGAYDHLRRFELADRAYATAIRIGGETVQIINNQSQSYMLRGDFRTARAKLRKALRLDPSNPIVINNIRILDANDPALARKH